MKSKIVKRVLAASLATVMTASLAACGSDKPADASASSADAATDASTDAATDESTDAATESSVEDLGAYTIRTDANGNTVDLGGIEVIIRDWFTPGDGTRPEAEDAYNEARNEYLDWAEETYNFTVKQMTISDWGSTPQDFADYATLGGDEYYIFTLRQCAEAFAAMNSGLMYDVASLGVFDFSEKKWQGHGVQDVYSIGDAVYAFRGIEPEPRGGLYFNKRLLSEAGINPQQIYDWQESGEWTWAKFEEVCSQVQADTDNDGVIDRFGMANFNSDFFPIAVYSNNADFVKRIDGKFVNTVESEETLEALNWALDMWDKYDAHVAYPEDASWDYWNTAYSTGMAVFNVAECYKAGQFNSMGMEDDFGFVCFPMGPKATDYTNCLNDNIFAIPACYDADKAWKCAFVYDIFTEPIPGFEDYSGYKSSYYSTMRDTESVDLTVNRMLSNGRMTFHTIVPGFDISGGLIWAINKDNTPAQQAEAMRDTWNAYIDEANK